VTEPVLGSDLSEQPRMTESQFLDWAETQDARYELVDGIVMMQAGATRDHERVAKRIFAALLWQVDEARFDVNKAISASASDRDGRREAFSIPTSSWIGGAGRARKGQQRRRSSSSRCCRRAPISLTTSISSPDTA
jgi:hypothetical protein